MWKKPIKSKSRFSGDYKKELAKLVDSLDETFENPTDWGHFVIDSVQSASTNVRLRVSDPDFGGQMIVNCVLWYHHDDEKYGYVNVDLVTSGLSRKTETRFVGKFNVSDHEAIVEKVCRDLSNCVRF